MGEDAGIAPAGDSDACGQRPLKHRHRPAEPFGLRVRRRPPLIAGDCLGGGQRRTQGDTPISHQGQRLGGSVRAVLDGPDACFDRTADPLIGRGVGRDPEPGAPRFVHGRLQLGR